MKSTMIEIQFNGKDKAYVYLHGDHASTVEKVSESNIQTIIEAFRRVGFDVLLHRMDAPEQFFEATNKFVDEECLDVDPTYGGLIYGFSNPNKQEHTIMCNVDGYVIPKGKL